jgi:hypothetical protein
MNEINHSPLKTFPNWFKIFLSYLLAGTPPYIMMTPALFDHLRARGVPVWFMTVNREKELDLAIKYGATCVLSDRGGWLIDLMKEKGKSLKKIE